MHKVIKMRACISAHFVFLLLFSCSVCQDLSEPDGSYIQGADCPVYPHLDRWHSAGKHRHPFILFDLQHLIQTLSLNQKNQFSAITTCTCTHTWASFWTSSGKPSEGEHLLWLRQEDQEHGLVLLPAHAKPPGPLHRPHGEATGPRCWRPARSCWGPHHGADTVPGRAMRKHTYIHTERRRTTTIWNAELHHRVLPTQVNYRGVYIWLILSVWNYWRGPCEIHFWFADSIIIITVVSPYIL